MPLCQTAAAAGCSCMLSDKYRVTAKRRLLAVIHRLSWSQTTGNKIPGVVENNRHSLRLQVLPLLDVKGEPSPECGLRECFEQIVQITQIFAGATGCRPAAR